MNQPINWSPGTTLEDIEKQVILYAYRWFRGNATQTAIALGVSDKTLRHKLEKYEQDGRKQQEAEEHEQQTRIARLNRARGLPASNQSTEGVVFGTGAGVHVEPAAEVKPQHAVSVPEPEEVQSVLPVKVAAGREHRRR